MNVLIFANCQGSVYGNFLKRSKIKNLKLEHIVSYKSLTEFEKLKEKFKTCDTLIIQPIKNYKEFTLNHIKTVVKSECQIITVPYLRFNGFWPELETYISLTKVVNLGVKIPNIKTEIDIWNFLKSRDLSKEDMVLHFNKCYDNLQNHEEEVDIKYMDFFDSNFKSIPLFRDYNHPAARFSNYLQNEFVKIFNEKLGTNIPQEPFKAIKDFGHYDVISDVIAEVLNLEYDLDSYYPITRFQYLKLLLNYENSKNKIIQTMEDFIKLIKTVE